MPYVAQLQTKRAVEKGRHRNVHRSLLEACGTQRKGNRVNLVDHHSDTIAYYRPQRTRKRKYISYSAHFPNLKNDFNYTVLCDNTDTAILTIPEQTPDRLFIVASYLLLLRTKSAIVCYRFLSKSPLTRDLLQRFEMWVKMKRSITLG